MTLLPKEEPDVIAGVPTYIKLLCVFSTCFFFLLSFRGCFEKKRCIMERRTLPADEEESWTERLIYGLLACCYSPGRSGQQTTSAPWFLSFFYLLSKEEKYPSRCSLLWFFECLTCCWNSLSPWFIFKKGMYRDGLHFISYKWRNERKVVTGKDGGRRHSRVCRPCGIDLSIDTSIDVSWLLLRIECAWPRKSSLDEFNGPKKKFLVKVFLLVLREDRYKKENHVLHICVLAIVIHTKRFKDRLRISLITLKVSNADESLPFPCK